MRESSYEKLLPPLVHQLRRKVKQWRDDNYQGATETSISLLNWWFNTEHLLAKAKNISPDPQEPLFTFLVAAKGRNPRQRRELRVLRGEIDLHRDIVGLHHRIAALYRGVVSLQCGFAGLHRDVAGLR